MNANTLKNKSDLMSNENYRKYNDKKLEILKKYNENLFDIYDTNPGRPLKKKVDYINSGEQEEYRRWVKDVVDLLLEPNGYYQKFVWDVTSTTDKMIQERMTRKIEKYSVDN